MLRKNLCHTNCKILTLSTHTKCLMNIIQALLRMMLRLHHRSTEQNDRMSSEHKIQKQEESLNTERLDFSLDKVSVLVQQMTIDAWTGCKVKEKTTQSPNLRKTSDVICKHLQQQQQPINEVKIGLRCNRQPLQDATIYLWWTGWNKTNIGNLPKTLALDTSCYKSNIQTRRKIKIGGENLKKKPRQ